MPENIQQKINYIAKADTEERVIKMNKKSNIITSKNGLLDNFWINIKTAIMNKGIATSNQNPKTTSTKSELNVTRSCAGVFNNIIIDINNKHLDITLNVVTRNQMSNNTKFNISMLSTNKNEIKNILINDDTQSEFLWFNNFNMNSTAGIQTLFAVRKKFDIFDIDKIDNTTKWVTNILIKYGTIFDTMIKKINLGGSL